LPLKNANFETRRFRVGKRMVRSPFSGFMGEILKGCLSGPLREAGSKPLGGKTKKKWPPFRKKKSLHHHHRNALHRAEMVEKARKDVISKGGAKKDSEWRKY